MKRIISIFAVILGLAPAASATNRFGLNASNIVSGQLDPLRVNLSSFTMQGNTVQLINGTVVFGDGSIQNTAAGSSVWSTNGTHIYPTNTGNVGVGTQNPTARFDVRGAMVTTGTVNLAGSNGNVGIGTLTTGTSLLDIVGGSVTIRGSGTGLSVIGNTGIGTNNPANKLDVVGAASISGNTGIGTNSPSSLLDVSGGSLTIRGAGAGLVVSNGSATAVGFVATNGGYQTTDGSVISGVATIAQTRAFTSSSVVVSPALEGYHPGVSKAWGVVIGTSASEIQNSYNFSSVTNVGGGVYTLTFTKPMLNNRYVVIPIPDFHSGGSAQICQPDWNTGRTVTGFKIDCWRTSTEGGVSPNEIHIDVLGDQ